MKRWYYDSSKRLLIHVEVTWTSAFNAEITDGEVSKTIAMSQLVSDELAFLLLKENQAVHMLSLRW